MVTLETFLRFNSLKNDKADLYVSAIVAKHNCLTGKFQKESLIITDRWLLNGRLLADSAISRHPDYWLSYSRYILDSGTLPCGIAFRYFRGDSCLPDQFANLRGIDVLQE